MRLFGTDGVRGLANADLLPETALALGRACVRVLASSGSGRPLAVVGRDPRASGEMLEAAVLAGLASAGCDVLRLGVVPTPATAVLTATLGADLGIMISASHNPMPDNGIKVFGPGGGKLRDDLEHSIEAELASSRPPSRPVGAAIGRLRDLPDAVERYVDHLLACVPADLRGVRVVLDCAHGAASTAAPEALRRAGADVTVIHASPDGLNINAGVGSTHLGPLQEAVRELGADVGIAHDGDADRCLAVDALGSVVDGDQILAVLAVAKAETGDLVGDAVVTTVMTNLGFHRAMAEHAILVHQTPVGDRHVLSELLARGLVLGGEQSGHLLFLDDAPTGDGPLTALHLLARMAQTGQPLAELAAVMTRLPQVLLAVPVSDRDLATDPRLSDAVQRTARRLADTGRVLVRPSGTEPVIRVMVEAESEELARREAQALADAVEDLSAAQPGALAARG